jgi:hypothetical protein
MMSVEEIVRSILDLEEKHRLFDIKYRGKYPIWPFYRMYFFSAFNNYLGVYQNKKGLSYKKDLLKKIYLFAKLTFASKILRLFLPKKKKYLIISSQRYKNGEEIYTRDLKKILKVDYLELSLSQYFIFQKGPFYLDFYKVIFKVLSYFLCRFYVAPKSIGDFMDEIGASERFIREYLRYRIEYGLWFHFFSLVFRIHKPKKVFFVSGVYFTPMLAAAENKGIQTFEIQHGVINEYHLAYHFPGLDRKGFFSNGLLLLSDYWKSKAQYPAGTQLISIGNDAFNSSRKDILSKSKKSVVFLSQPIIAKSLIDFLYQNIDFFNDHSYKINYKLHPSEYINWERNYPILKEMEKRGALEVISTHPLLNTLLNESEYIFGVSSTAIYEGLDRLCKVFIVKLPSSIYFKDLGEKGVIKLLDPNRRIDENVMNFEPAAYEVFFAQTDFNSIKMVVEK